MTEADIAIQLSELFDRWWVIHQWWVGVSFALIAIVHFARERLNLTLASAILVLYVAFSLRLNSLVVYNVAIMQAYIEDLRVLDSAGELQSTGTAEFLYGWEQLGRYNLAEEIAIYGTFVGVILYFSHSVFQHRRRRAS